MIRIFLFTGMLFFILSCYNSKNANDRSGFEIYFGKTGGFTNLPMEYLLNEDGKILKIQNDTTIEIQTITRKQMKALKNLLDEIEFQDIDINEPGNITYYIRADTKKYKNTVRWTDSSDNQKVKDLYRQLLTILK